LQTTFANFITIQIFFSKELYKKWLNLNGHDYHYSVWSVMVSENEDFHIKAFFVLHNKKLKKLRDIVTILTICHNDMIY